MFKRQRGPERARIPLTLRLYNRFVHKYWGRDVGFELQLMARREAALYIARHMTGATMYADRWQLLSAAIEAAAPNGLFLELGVGKGASANFIARSIDGLPAAVALHAFDSFEGLPEDWVGTAERAGKFSLHGKIPALLPNIVVHQGWFDDTLPRFCDKLAHAGIAFAHIDCDLYSSTHAVFNHLGGLLRAGSILVFDEYFNYHGWRNHEFRAWQEFVRARSVRYCYRGFCTRGGSVYVRIDGIDGAEETGAATDSVTRSAAAGDPMTAGAPRTAGGPV
jgi:predicted O-methyltransferase YrrM